MDLIRILNYVGVTQLWHASYDADSLNRLQHNVICVKPEIFDKFISNVQHVTPDVWDTSPYLLSK